MTKTLQEWADLDGVKILDPDGFDRTDPELWERQFTKEEFMRGIANCTIRCSVETIKRWQNDYKF
jgi:hypothetical protein